MPDIFDFIQMQLKGFFFHEDVGRFRLALGIEHAINIRFQQFCLIIITTMQEEVIIEPPLYFAPDALHIWTTHFHPLQDVLAAPLINGNILLLKYSSEDVVPLRTITTAHRSSSRYCRFNPSGNLLATCGQDKRLAFIDASGEVSHIIKKAHPSPINRVHFANDTLLISGDDDGLIKVWDLRTTECVFEAQDQSDTITGMIFDQQHVNVLSSCLDGTIAIYDLRQGMDSERKLYAKSDSVDQELHSIQYMKNGQLLICPSSQNSILIYRRDSPQVFIDRVQGIPGCVEAVLKIDEDTFLAGSEDGFVRAFSLRPNKLLQVVGQHQENEHFPVQSLALSRCRNIVASTSHDNSIKFYDVSQLVRQRSQPRVKEQEEIVYKQSEGLLTPAQQDESDLFEDISNSDDDDDSQQMQQKPKKKKKKNINIKSRETEMKKEHQRKFFEGL